MVTMMNVNDKPALFYYLNIMHQNQKAPNENAPKNTRKYAQY